MAKTNNPVFTQNIFNTGTSFVDTDGTAFKTIATAGADDSRILHVTITTDDTSPNTAFLAINDGVNDFEIGWVNVGAGAGTDGGTDAVSMLAATTFFHRQIDNNANPYLELQATYTLRLRMGTAVGATFTTNVVVAQEDY